MQQPYPVSLIVRTIYPFCHELTRDICDEKDSKVMYLSLRQSLISTTPKLLPIATGAPKFSDPERPKSSVLLDDIRHLLERSVVLKY